MEDEVLGYKIELSGHCETELGIIDSLPEGKKAYIKRRIDVQSESPSSSSSSS